MQFIENKIDIRIINECIVLCRVCIVQRAREVSSGSWEIGGLSEAYQHTKQRKCVFAFVFNLKHTKYIYKKKFVFIYVCGGEGEALGIYLLAKGALAWKKFGNRCSKTWLILKS